MPALEQGGRGDLAYHMGCYPGSELRFRTPVRRLSDEYIAVLGGSEVYGKYVTTPLPDLLKNRLGVQCLNFGAMNASPQMFLADGKVCEYANAAQATVIQIMGAHNQSNRFYRVHNLRNDRFLEATPLAVL